MTVTPVVISPSASNGDAIPLMTSSTSGRNNSASFRDGLINAMGLPTSTNNDVYPRYGVLGRTMTTNAGANGINSLLVHAPAVPNGLQFVVEPGNAVVQANSTTGGYLVNSKTALTLTLDAANAFNPRWDLVYLQVSDVLASASSTVVQIAVVTGASASTPTVPNLPTATAGVQFMKLGAIKVPAAATNLTGATFADLRTGTSVNGLPRPVLGGDLLTDAGAVAGERRVRQHATYGTLVDQYGYDSVWHGGKHILIAQPTQTGYGSLPAATTATVASVAIADPGYAYHIKTGGMVDFGATNAGRGLTCSINVGSAVLGTNAITAGHGTSVVAGTGSDVNAQLAVKSSLVLNPAGYTGAQTLYFVAKNTDSQAMTLYDGVSAHGSGDTYVWYIELIPA